MLAATPSLTWAAPYASGVNISGTNVRFILNEPADNLSVSINGGAPTALDGTAKGEKQFTLGAPTDTFVILAQKNDPVGYTIPTGNTVPVAANGLSQPAPEAGYHLLSDNTNPLLAFNNPRGVSVSTDPTAPNFGTAYVSNTTPAGTKGRGLYALNADQSDAYGYGNTAQNPSSVFTSASANSPFRVQVASDGSVYVTDWSDPNAGLFKLSPDLTTAQQVLAGIGDTSANHGSIPGAHAVVSPSGLTVYTVDEDLRTVAAPGDDRNSIWRYDIGNSTLPYSDAPTKIASVLLPLATADITLGADGKIYAGQNRAAGNEAGIFVLDLDGTVLFDSLAESRSILGNPSATDIIRNVQGVAVSPDQKWMAVVLNGSDVAVVPLVNGIPSLADVTVVDTGTNINSGRDIAFDAAGNIHYVSSGQAIYRVLSPGGVTAFATSWDGTSLSFSSVVPEPAMLGMLSLSAMLLARRRKE